MSWSSWINPYCWIYGEAPPAPPPYPSTEELTAAVRKATSKHAPTSLWEAKTYLRHVPPPVPQPVRSLDGEEERQSPKNYLSLKDIVSTEAVVETKKKLRVVTPEMRRWRKDEEEGASKSD